MATTDELLTVIDSFVGHDGKEERIFRAGDLVKPDDPAVKKWPQLFGPAQLGAQIKTPAVPLGRRR
jgi:hypothetical protein